MLETRSAASIKQRKDADLSKPNDHKSAQLQHVKNVSRDKADNEASLVTFHLTGQINDCLIDSWVPRSTKDRADPMNCYLKSLGAILLPLVGMEQEKIDARMGSLLQMQYNLTILNYLDTVLITRQEKFKNYVKSVARMAAGGFQNTVEREVFHELHAQVVDELSDMVATCRYYLELCPQAKESFTESQGSSFDPEFSISERSRLDALFKTTLKRAPPIQISQPQFFAVSDKLTPFLYYNNTEQHS